MKKLINFKKKKKTTDPTLENQKPKRKIDKTNLAAIIVSGIAAIGLICLAIGIIVIVVMLISKPDMDINNFISTESSIVYDENGDVVAELGNTIRENVTYDELPECLIDAFVATEDSRFFEHNGFDLPRFTKAMLSNLKSLSFSQGGSTFTMQLVKNTYFTNDDTGEQASRTGTSGIKRKVQEIALALELENLDEMNKQTILELYLNKLNFGGNRNIRGVQKAAQYYFGKDVSDLNLAESAMLAGIINAPNAYNPYNNLELATQRRNEVLYLMKYHGYITDTEYELAKSIKVEDLIAPEESSSNGEAISYQAYIDQVVSEVSELTGMDPYTTGMRIYTYMNKDVQGLMDDIQNGDYETIVYPDDEFEIASIAVNNETGAIVGILGGRNYADGGSLLLNHATQQYKQPGSSIKPILDYVLAFENLGWATDHVLVDKPITYTGTNTIISNSNGTYQGQVKLADALGNSLNTPAIQTLQAVIDAKGEDYVVEYMQNMGFDITEEDFDIQCAIGGNKLQVSCLQMAGAQGALINGGTYTEPHTISRIEFLDGKSPITPSYKSKQNVSAEASYMMATLLANNVTGGYANLMQILKDDYTVYAKTGTTDWGDSGTSYGIPTGAIKDAWMIGSTSEYTVATWIGYERAQKDKQSYIKLNDYLKNIQGKATNAILDETVDVYGQPHTLQKPDGVVSITHILATYPYAAPVDGMDEKYITTGLIKKEYYSLVNPETISVEAMTSDPSATYNTANSTLSITWPTYPNKDQLASAGDTMDISLKSSDGTVIYAATGKKLFDYSWLYGSVQYKADIKINGTYVTTVSSDTETATTTLSAKPGDSISICAYYAYSSSNLASSSKCITLSVEDSIITYTIPNSDASTIKSYLEGLGSTVVVTTQSTNPASSISITSGTSNYTPGATYSDRASDLANKTFIITTYQAPAALSLTSSSSENKVYAGKSITITASNYDSNVSWSVDQTNGISYNKDNNPCVLSVDQNYSGNSSIIVTAKDKSNRTASITISVIPAN